MNATRSIESKDLSVEPYLFSITLHLFLLLRLARRRETERRGKFLPDSELNFERSLIELCHGQPHRMANPRLPSVRDALFQQERPEVLDPSSENRQERRRAV